MSYTPTEWESTNVVTATRMNALEQAVGDMNMSYTPNTWSDGDILSADKMNALEQAVASGGGGSSDFSTAQVTFDNSAGAQFMLPVILTLPSGGTSASSIDAASGEIQAILYKGNAMGVILGGTVTVTGSATYRAPVLTVTGDCTITIS